MNKSAVITGVSYGLGAAICKKLLSMGYKVYGLSRTAPNLQNKQLVWIKTNLLHDDEYPIILKQITDQKIDLLVNNVGTAFLKKTLDYKDADFELMFGLNFKVHAKITKLLFTRLTGGIIINISSLSDRYPDPMWGLYGSSKAALNLFFETMALETQNVKIINMLPSYVDTPLQHKLNDGNQAFDWSSCMKSEDVATAVGYVVKHKEKLETGTRVIVEKDSMANDQYNPEKLWVYCTAKRTLTKVR